MISVAPFRGRPAAQQFRCRMLPIQCPPRSTMKRARRIGAAAIILAAPILPAVVRAQYVNFESSQVHPVALTPSGGKLLLVNTPDALLEVFTVQTDGSLAPQASIPVGLEPVTVVARSDAEAWVVNHLSDTISIVDLNQRST